MLKGIPLLFLILFVSGCKGEWKKTPEIEAKKQELRVESADTSKERHRVLNGIDVLERDGFRMLKGKKLGLITNHTGRSIHGRSSIDLLRQNANMVCIFAPEHGLEGMYSKRFRSGIDEGSGLPIISLYGRNRRPTKKDLSRVDALVFDIQNIGVRYYTYITTMGYCMEEAARYNKEFIVLDRPDPIASGSVWGAVPARAECKSFICYHPLATYFGMTNAELALMIKEEKGLNLNLTIVKMEGWMRNMGFKDTGLEWIPPSPNLKRISSLIPYATLGWLEHSNISVGRGTDTPFETYGAPFINGKEITDSLNNLKLKGVVFKEARYVPEAKPYKGKECHGFSIEITDQEGVDGTSLSASVLYFLIRLYKGEIKFNNVFKLALGSGRILDKVMMGASREEIIRLMKDRERDFMKRRGAFLLYE